MKGKVPTFDPLYHIPSLLMALESICLSLKWLSSYNNGCEVFSPLRVSESQSRTRKTATIEKVIESVNQAVSSSYIWSESIINKD